MVAADLARVPADQAVAVALEVVQDREVGAMALVAAADLDPARVRAVAITGKGTVPGRMAQAEAAKLEHGILWAVAAEDRDWIQMLEASG